MPPPPAEPFASRIFLGPALRTQPDRRLVKLVREGYETAFEEIVRRYRKPLDRFAAAFVGGRSEDVTQDAFSKALLALRGTTAEIELRPWLYRIVRNTALNDLRDGPPPTEELGETIPGGRSAAVEAERREEIAELMERLRALPEPQRAAIVMRELEGLSHEEIAAALGVSGGAARQAIHRARVTLRDGLGLLVPLPLLRLLFDHGAEAAGAGAAGAATGAASVAGGGGAALGGIGAAGALKVGLATALLAGSVGAGVAMQHDRGARGGPEPAATSATRLPVAEAPTSFDSAVRPRQTVAVMGGGGGGHGDNAPRGDDRGKRGDGSSGEDLDDSSRSGDGSGSGNSSRHGGRGSGHGDRSGHGDGSGEDRSGGETSGGSRSGRHGSGHGSDDGSGSRGSGGGGHGSGSGSSGDGGNGGGSGSSGHGGGSGDSGSRHGGSGSSDDPAATTSPPPLTEPPAAVDSGDSGESGSGGGGSGSDGGHSGGGEDDS